MDCNGDIYACWGGYYKDDAKEYLIGNMLEKDFDDIFMSDKKEVVCAGVVRNCEGCLLPRDIERETDTFGFSTKLTYDEVAVLAEDLTNLSTLDDYSVDRGEWYDQEKYNGVPFRWMKKKDVTLYVNVRDKKPEKLIIHYINGYVPSKEQEQMKVTFTLQDEKSIVMNCELGENTGDIALPESLKLSGLVKLDISVDKLWKPSDINKESFDERPLGIGVFSVELA